VQGPDGDEISINGQKGINNNLSIDGADNNNPFFGEQRGGQRSRKSLWHRYSCLCGSDSKAG